MTRQAEGDNAPAPPAPPGDAVEEVRVLAPRRDVGGTQVRREDARSVPGAFGDPTRIAEILPGVVPSTSGLQAFFVRGAPPTSTGYFVDGVPIPVLYHVGFGPSVVHPAFLGDVAFFEGAAPARFGRVIGATIAATTRPPEARPHAEANVRLFDAGAFAETPLAEGRGDVAAAARYGYPGLVVPLFAPDIGLGYWDYQARAGYRLSSRDRVSAFVFGSSDLLTQTQTVDVGPPVMRQLVNDQFHRIDLRWDRALGEGASLQVGATLGRDQVGDSLANAVDDSMRLRAEVDARLAPNLRARGGADIQIDRLRPGDTPPGSPLVAASDELVAARDSAVIGVHADVAWHVTPDVEIVPGLRVDLYDVRDRPGRPSEALTAQAQLGPRLAARVHVGSGVAAVSTFGISHQLPGLNAQFPDSTPLLQPGLQEGIQTSTQASQALEFLLPARIFLSSTVFLHDYSGLADVTAPCLRRADDPDVCATPNVDGRAYGLELLLRRPFSERLTFWIAYTLSRSTRQARSLFSLRPTMDIPSEYDRTHVLSAIVSYELPHHWRIGGRLFAYSGRPYTTVSFGLPVVPYNSARLPGFYRLDTRIEKAWDLGPHTRLTLVGEWMNVTLNKEGVSATCFSPGPSPAVRGAEPCSVDNLGPIVIPSIGLEANFE